MNDCIANEMGIYRNKLLRRTTQAAVLDRSVRPRVLAVLRRIVSPSGTDGVLASASFAAAASISLHNSTNSLSVKVDTLMSRSPGRVVSLPSITDFTLK